ncbi:MAG: hypothetical protein HWQ38_00080 [Nostoc sp. NMS7]|uniref:hypothetical protein n=1 Tax=Nostoc sp. NMS7 TaxID=2815391 RepID=UPI0025F73F4B|nr:hypothetical protein [Nostoc sp. NMS7]MBN3944963.1 hypothetical protein [Nostoc sp. NMS7]
MSGVNFEILGVCTPLTVECYPKVGVGDCGGGEVRSRNSLKIDWRLWGLVVTPGSHDDFGSHDD